MAATWIRARHEGAGEAILSVDALPLHEVTGWVPFGEPNGDRAVLVAEVDAEAAEAARVAAVRAEAAAEVAEDGTRDEVLATVGDDPVAARAALAAEEAKDAPRKTLVAKLREITDRPDTATTTEGN